MKTVLFANLMFDLEKVFVTMIKWTVLCVSIDIKILDNWLFHNWLFFREKQKILEVSSLKVFSQSFHDLYFQAELFIKHPSYFTYFRRQQISPRSLASKSSHDNTIWEYVTITLCKRIALPPNHDMCICHSPAWPLPTESVTEQVVHVLGFAIVGSIVILVHTHINSLSLTVRLKTKWEGITQEDWVVNLNTPKSKHQFSLCGIY